jgi:hypothetical protein
MGCNCNSCKATDPRPRAVFVRANVVDDDGDIYRATKGEAVTSFDVYLQVPGGYPTFDEGYASFEDAVHEARRFAEFAGCALVLELADDTIEVKPEQFHGLAWVLVWGDLQAKGWVKL